MVSQARGRMAGMTLCAGIALAIVLGSSTGPAVQAADAPYRLVENWPQLPPNFGAVAGVAIDAKGIVYAFHRDTGEISRFDQSGKFLGKWDNGKQFSKSTASAENPREGGAHHIEIDREGFIWTVDRNEHVVKKWRPDGSLALTIGKEGTYGATPGLFNGPTRVRQLANGNFLVADGYWNSRLVWFDKNGKFLKTSGSYGRGPGQFGTLHDVVEDSRGRLLIVDLCNGIYVPEVWTEAQVDPRRKTPGATCNGKDDRIQIVDKDGKQVAVWTDIKTPLSLAVAGQRIYASAGTRIAILDAATGKEIEAIEGTSAHSIAVDSQGDVYLANFRAPNILKRYTRKAK